jgi:hypothetical protein
MKKNHETFRQLRQHFPAELTLDLTDLLKVELMQKQGGRPNSGRQMEILAHVGSVMLTRFK